LKITAHGIICDDIRREDNGKLLIIGAYDGGFVPGKIPVQFPLSLWLTVHGVDVGTHDFKLQLVFPDDKKFESEGELEVLDDAMPASMFFIGFPAAITGFGEIVGTVWVNSCEIEFIRVPVIESEQVRG